MSEQPSRGAVSRSAHAAIAGYEYQFDKTALTLLATSDEDVVEIEGIEDIDLHSNQASEAVQVKYFAGQDYSSPKSLLKPVRLMLEHYKTGARWDYVLYIHFRDFGEIPSRLDVAQLKQCLTVKKNKGPIVKYFEGVHDDDLADFCTRLRIVRGQAFEVQEAELINTLRVTLGCDADEVLAIYLAKVRDFVHERARIGEVSARRVTRQELVDWLSVKDLLYDKWQMQRIGSERYLAAQKRELLAANFHDPTKKRAVYMEISADSVADTARLCESFASKHAGRLKSAQPWTVIVDGSQSLVRQLKVELIRSGVAFNDGHEHLEFRQQAFVEPPIINTRGSGDRIERSSFTLRLITRQNFESVDFLRFKVSRLISIGDPRAWMHDAADQVFALRHFEPTAYGQLLEKIA